MKIITKIKFFFITLKRRYRQKQEQKLIDKINKFMEEDKK